MVIDQPRVDTADASVGKQDTSQLGLLAEDDQMQVPISVNLGRPKSRYSIKDPEQAYEAVAIPPAKVRVNNFVSGFHRKKV